jgi:hypothetical protein
MENVKLGQAEFFERWKLIGGPPREAQAIFPISLSENGNIDAERHRQVVAGSSMNVLDGLDPNPNNIVAAGILHMSVEGKVGCLMRLEPNKDAKVCHLAFLDGSTAHLYVSCVVLQSGVLQRTSLPKSKSWYRNRSALKLCHSQSSIVLEVVQCSAG